MPANHPVFAALRRLRNDGPVVVAHRGDSENFAENTLPAFQAACRLGVPMQEFDVRCTREGTLVCIHDATFDRTTDAAARLGPGALVAETTFREARSLDASSWRRGVEGGARVPSLTEVLDLLLPGCIAMVEHKAGEPEPYLRELRSRSATGRCILQSFEWDFVAAARRGSPDLALALLGPTPDCAELRDAIPMARQVSAGMLHWHDRALRYEDVLAAHEAGLLVCTYTTDDELGCFGGAAMGIDAMCTNKPRSMLALSRSGLLRRQAEP